MHNLNKKQLEAVDHKNSNLIISAGPGTGKTYTICCKIKHAVTDLSENEQILAVTFTNKAASEVRQNIVAEGSNYLEKMFIGTFHSFCLSLLRETANQYAFIEHFEVASKRQIEKIVIKGMPNLSSQVIKSFLKEVLYAKKRFFDEPDSLKIKNYNNILRINGYYDYDDLIIECVKILQNNQELKELIRKKYKYIFVDEYQDINKLQFYLLKEIVGKDNILTVIGDASQSIYGFRGASPKYFHEFEQMFAPCEKITLVENYRSTKNLIEVSAKMLNLAQHNMRSNFVATAAAQDKVFIHKAFSEKEESEFVVKAIDNLVGGRSFLSNNSKRMNLLSTAQESFGNIAILYRINYQKLILERALNREGIPFRSTGDIPLLEKPGVHEFITCLKLSFLKHVESVDVLDCLQLMVRGFGINATQETMDLLKNNSKVDIEKLMNLLKQHSLYENIDRVIKSIDPQRIVVENNNFVEIVETLSKNIFWQNILFKNPDWKQDIDQVIRISKRLNSIDRVVDFLSLEKPDDKFERNVEKVTLSTLHASKGLEFDVVFIVGCEENLIPLRVRGFEADLDEERRLFYVGMSRARKQLFLTSAKQRMFFGHHINNEQSSFVKNIQGHLLEI